MNKDIMRACGFGDMVESVENGRCPICKKTVCDEDFDELSELYFKEFKIYGMCPSCQEEIFNPKVNLSCAECSAIFEMVDEHSMICPCCGSTEIEEV